jgi:parvulin-like peptidyl-prolyl isomerase
MYFHKIVLITITAFILSYACFAQISNQKVIAKIGNYEITEDEFLERYELTPQVNAAIRGMDKSLKKEVLYSIIAEKLWAIEAEETGLSNSELIKSTYKAIEKMYVRDVLYYQEISSKVQISDNYLKKAYRKNNLILKLNYLFSRGEEEINQLYEKLQEGISFDSLLLQRAENVLQLEPYEVSYGKMEKNVEDALYKLIVGEFTTPLKAPNGWYIFKLLSSDEKIIQNVKQAHSEQKNVIKIVKSTITDSIYKEFYSSFFVDASVETNGKLFLELSDLVVKAMKHRSKIEDVSAGSKFYLRPEDLYRIEDELGPRKLNEEFISLNDQAATLSDFLQELAFEQFSVASLDTALIRGKLNLSVKNFIEHELLAREGYRRGLHFSAEIQRYLKMWRSYYLSDALRKELLESIDISDEEAFEYFNEKKQETITSMEVKIIELLSDNLDVIRDALNELEMGTEFRELAVKYTNREEAKNNNGELGFFPVSDFGEIGQQAAIMNVGDLYGPLKVSEGYSLFKLIDKREEHNLSKLNFNNEKEKIKSELRYKQFSNEIISKTVELANKYNVSINQEILDSLKVLNTTTVVYRYFGFGGRLLAVPMTLPNYLWVKSWKEQEILSP